MHGCLPVHGSGYGLGSRSEIECIHDSSCGLVRLSIRCSTTILQAFVVIQLERTTERACFYLKQRRLSFSAGENGVSFSGSWMLH